MNIYYSASSKEKRSLTGSIRKPEVFLGSSEDNDIRIDGDQIAKVHAKIVFSADKLLIEDLNISPDTFLNGVVIREPCEIEDSDTVQIGNWTFSFSTSHSQNVSKSSQKLTWTQKTSELRSECL